jgi:putative ABC transport system permease protein
MNINENIKIAFGSIRANMLRTVLTSLIIAIGIMALVGILTSIDGMKKSINENFASMGANSFSIRNRASSGVRIGSSGQRPKRHEPITYDQAIDFKNTYTFPATVSISAFASFIGTAKYESKKTNPNLSIIGTDDNYILTGGYKLDKGRVFSQTEMEFGSNVTLIGYEIG